MYRYLIIESKKEIQSEETLILTLFSEYITIDHSTTLEREIHLFYKHGVDVSFLDIVLNMMSDTYSDFRIFVSHTFGQEGERDQHLDYIRRELSKIGFNQFVYLDDKVILKNNLNRISEETKHFILRKYHRDQIMLETIKTYLESNQNMSIASKKIYMHRNTLIQRIDKFHQTTGFDVRVFNDA
ncbi:MAG: helix-turn-helix domain-containing protein, partial [Acholeplasmataceae bacterium]|nr:helix-turn-helix domain-containing protein [Acholeplasmataceae bacterium]